MPNPDNVKPYGELVHRAAQCGGPDAFLEKISREQYAQGKRNGLLQLIWAAPASVGVFEAGKWIYKQLRYGYQVDRHLENCFVERLDEEQLKWENEIDQRLLGDIETNF